MAFRQLPGQGAPADPEKRPVEPRPESVEGVSFPYRGSEQHGVKADTNPDLYDDSGRYSLNFEPDVVPAPIEPEDPPIAVRVVQEHRRERLEWRAGNVLVGEGKALQIVGRLSARRRLTIVNNDAANSVYIGADDGVKDYTGYELKAGQDVSFTSTEDVWAIAAAGQTVKVSFLYEYAVEL